MIELQQPELRVEIDAEHAVFTVTGRSEADQFLVLGDSAVDRAEVVAFNGDRADLAGQLRRESRLAVDLGTETRAGAEGAWKSGRSSGDGVVLLDDGAATPVDQDSTRSDDEWGPRIPADTVDGATHENGFTVRVDPGLVSSHLGYLVGSYSTNDPRTLGDGTGGLVSHLTGQPDDCCFRLGWGQRQTVNSDGHDAQGESHQD